MKSIMSIFHFTLFVILTNICNPQSPADNNRSTGNEIIAYCYQPMSGNELKSIYTIDSDGSDNQILMSADIGLNHHNWSPDGSKMACLGYSDENTWSIYTFDSDGSNLSRLTNEYGVWDTEPSWSPDGSKIAFSRVYPNQNNKSEIWIMDWDGANQINTGIEGFAQKWSVDGNRIIFQSSLFGSSDIYTCNIDGSEIEQITFTNESEAYPEWSPDGSKICFVRYTDYYQTDGYEIFIVESDGSNEIQLTNNNYLDHYPRWSPDGSRLAFITDELGEMKFEVFIMTTQGTDKYQLTDSPDGYTAINPAWKPDVNTQVEEKSLNNLGLKAYPNPFTFSTTFKYEVKDYSNISLIIYDLYGKEIIKLIDENQMAGIKSISWDRTNYSGQKVKPGVYYGRLNKCMNMNISRKQFSTTTIKLVIN